jgi:hypothetical protein
MTQVKSRLKRLEEQCLVRDHHSLDALFQQAEEMVTRNGIKFADAANELIRDLTRRDLDSIIAEAVSQYGKLGDPLCKG